MPLRKKTAVLKCFPVFYPKNRLDGAVSAVTKREKKEQMCTCKKLLASQNLGLTSAFA